VLFSSVTELHSYIDRTQLTHELGGTQEYCHDKWISHRTAIEGFALMVKKTAQTLQLFGTELAETELPNEIQATTLLLSTHTSKKNRMKVTPFTLDTLYICLQYMVCVGKKITESVLLSQLDETERAFDEFWVRHQTKLEQCLQLRHFEHSYREVSLKPEVLMFPLLRVQKLNCGIFLLLQVRALLDQVSEKLATFSEGEELIKNSHYAEDSIQPKCSELRAISETVSSSLRILFFTVFFFLLCCLPQASKWVDDGIYLLASQPVDKCQSHEGAELALQELERYLEKAEQNQLTELSTIWDEYEAVINQQLRVRRLKNIHRRISLKKLAAKQTRPVQPVAPRPEAFIKSPLSSPGYFFCMHLIRSLYSLFVCRHVMNELLETERAYVEELLCVLQGYASEMDNQAMVHLMPAPLQNKKEVLFGNMPEIYHFHKRTFLRELEQYTDCPQLVGRCFIERMTDLQIYEKYCHNKPRSESLWRQCSDCAFFQECQKKLEHKLGLDSYLLKPVQRITKYQLLLKEMLKYSKSCEGADDLQEALTSILGILKAVNDSMHLIAITGYEGNMSELGKLLMQGSFSVWTEHKKGHAKVKDLARFKPMQRHIFLHEKALIFCKRREENGEGYEKAPSYSFKQSLSMSAVGITENAKGDHKKFEIWCNSREEVYIVQVYPKIPTMRKQQYTLKFGNDCYCLNNMNLNY
uniref:MCF.2 cell line derived transforming sequence like n=1 Tax=Labrus bergylta TaxID=56723 RepID=A0A3Q3EKM0_9LABR